MMSNQMKADNRTLSMLAMALEQKRELIQRGISSWSTSIQPRYTWRQSGKTPYEVLIGETWLEKTGPSTAATIYQSFLRRFPTLQDLARATDDDLSGLLSQFGLRQHVPQVRLLAEEVSRQGNGHVPRNSSSLCRASRLQPHSISIIMCFGYGLPTAIIDSNVERMLVRIFDSCMPLCPPHGLLKAIAENMLPGSNVQRFNSALLELAEMVCKPEQATCSECPVKDACDYTRSLSLVKV